MIDLTTPIQPVGYERIRTDEEFLQHVDDIVTGKAHLSFSSLKSFVSGGAYGFYMYKTFRKAPTKSMLLGQMIEDFFLLDEEEINNKYATWVGSRRSKEAQKRYAEFVAKCQEEGKIIVDADMFVQARYAAWRIASHPEARNLRSRTTETQQELNIVIEGIKFKGYRDMAGSGFVADIKSASNIDTPRRLDFYIADMKYHYQAAIYTVGLQKTRYYLIVAMKSGGVEVVEITKQTRELALKEVADYVRRFKQAALEGELDAYAWKRSAWHLRSSEDLILKY